MLVNISDDLIRLQSIGLLDALLLDRTTKRHMMWATDAYAELGASYEPNEEIVPSLVTGDNVGLIKTRARKAFEQQNARTRKRGEVFTPLWIVKRMCDEADAAWFGRKDGFWKMDEAGKIRFTASRTWKHYVETRRMELTCGEAPFLTTRYDTESGELLPVGERVGLLDRKLRAVNENAESPDEWMEWTYRALRSVYGYEFQGDNLLIARVNLLMTFAENMEAVWGRKPMPAQYKKAIHIIAWNVWQMDGLTDRVPCRAAEEQVSLFAPDEKERRPWCRIYNWRQQKSVAFRSLKGAKTRMRFDFIIGNPPYQDETLGENKGFAPPIYDKFMEEAYKVADKVELIHPARFLFNAGSTPKAWNQKMLADPHLKVLHYEPDASKIFSNTDIKGGVAITYRDTNAEYGAIKTFTPYDELNSVLKRVNNYSDFVSLSSIVITRTAYRLTDKMHTDHPEAILQLSNGHAYDMSTNIFERLPQIFFDFKPNDDYEYIRILGREGNSRVYKFIRRDYVNTVKNLFKYKISLPKANGSGTFGEVLSLPVITEPGTGTTETFLSIGLFETEAEVSNALRYLRSKFFRAMLGILKTTQDITPEKFKYVPLQDFTPASDIDWSRPIPEIDRQLYAKYGLDQSEIDFIESHVKEMT